MKHFILTLACLGLFLLGPCRPLEALELELTGGVNRLTFRPESNQGDNNFKSYPYVFGDIIVKSNLFEKTGFKVHFSRDNIQKNSLFTMATANWDNFTIEFGPFLGMKDSLQDNVEHYKRLEIGIIGKFELAFPGIIFFSFSGSATMGSGLDFFSDNTRETAEFKIGFWVPYVIPSVSASFKNYTNKNEETSIHAEIYDELMRLQLSADLDIKNFPLALRLDAGYQIFSRTYDGVKEDKHEFSMVFAGAEGKIQVNKTVKVILGCELPIFPVKAKNIKKPITIGSLKAYAGVGFNIY